jgi:adenylate cyclase
MDTVAHKVLCFEGFTLDVMRGAVRNDDREIELRPKSFDVLLCLVEKAGQLVTKDEIIAAVWPNVAVTDESVTRCISDIRLALGDAEQRLIKTVHRRGYVFLPRVSEPVIDAGVFREFAKPPRITSAAPGTWTALRTWLRSGYWLVLACIALALMAIGAGTWLVTRQPSRSLAFDVPSIAVVPFVNASSDAQQDYFSDGISEEIVTSLSKFRELAVIAHHSMLSYKGTPFDARAIGRDLAVRYVLNGSVRRDGERLRVTAQLVDAATAAQIWAQQYDRGIADIFAIQDELTQKIVVTLVAHIGKVELSRVRRKPPEKMAAYDYYLRGRGLIEESYVSNPGEAIHAARVLLEKAVALDPRYPSALHALAHTYMLIYLEPTDYAPLAGEFQKQSTLDHALGLAQQAVALDGDLAEAHMRLAEILHWEYRRTESLAEWQRAFELNPNLAEGSYITALNHNDRAPEAIEYMQRIVRLNPFHSPRNLHQLGVAYFLTGRYAEALESLRTANERMPNWRPTFVWRAATAGQLGQAEEARAAAAQVLRLDPGFTIGGWLRLLRLASEEDSKRLADGLRKAGLPE